MSSSFRSDSRAGASGHWFRKNSAIYFSGMEAIRKVLPAKKRGLHIQLANDPFAKALGLPVCKENLRLKGPMALPSEDSSLDFIIVCFCDAVFNEQQALFREAYRKLNVNGSFIVAFVDLNSPAGKHYLTDPARRRLQLKKTINRTERIMFELSHTGFKHFEITQTLFDRPDKVKKMQLPKPGYGQGSFVVIQAVKKFNCARFGQT